MTDVVTLEDDNESYVDGEDPWANWDDNRVTLLASKYQDVLTTSDSAERLAAAKALVAEMYTEDGS